MSVIEKIVCGLLLAGILIIGAMYMQKSNKAGKVEAEAARLRLALSECSRQQDVVASAIERQNAAVEAVKIDTVFIERETQKVITRYSIIRDTIIKSIKKDSSCENQMANLTDVMRSFYGVRP